MLNETESLRARIAELEHENSYLKHILEKSGIDYSPVCAAPNPSEDLFDPDQGARIRHPREITEKMVKVFLLLIVLFRL